MVASKNSSRMTQRLLELKLIKAESQVRIHFRQREAENREIQRMSNETGISDDLLLRRLLKAGFCAETVVALRLFPIAMVAWASGSVSSEERIHAEEAIGWSNVTGNNPAIGVFRQWLAERPPQSMWDLWEDYMRAWSKIEHARLFEAEGQAVFQTARRIALASGGVLGLANICSAEREVLARIRKAFALDCLTDFRRNGRRPSITSREVSTWL